MKSVSADSSPRLREALRSGLPSVGPLLGRDHDAAETWIAFHAIGALDLAGVLSFPLTLSKRESPDFEFAMSAVIAGIEVSESIPTTYARAQAVIERDAHAGPFLRSAFEGLPDSISKSDLKQRIESPPPTHGYPGDSAESLTTSDLLKSIDRKLSARAKRGFATYPENWLLLYDNARRPLDFANVANRLALDRRWLGPFSQLLVLHGYQLAVWRGQAFTILEVPELGAAYQETAPVGRATLRRAERVLHPHSLDHDEDVGRKSRTMSHLGKRLGPSSSASRELEPNRWSARAAAQKCRQLIGPNRCAASKGLSYVRPDAGQSHRPLGP